MQDVEQEMSLKEGIGEERNGEGGGSRCSKFPQAGGSRLFCQV